MSYLFRTRLLPLVSLFLLALPLSAQDIPQSVHKVDPGPFYGFWEFQEPAGDKCVVIIKRGGRLSCFWAGTSTRAIQKGTWVRSGDELTANWETGHVDVFKKLGDNAVERNSYEPGSSILGDPYLTIRGVRVDSRIPGSLTIKSDETRIREEEVPDPQQAPAIPMRNAFIGFWKVDQSTGIFGIGGGDPHFYLKLARSGDASVALRDWEGDQDVRGRWRTEDDRVIVIWPNNRRDVLYQSRKGGYSLGTYKPKDKPTDKPRNPVRAEKVPPTEAERYFEAGNFSRLTVVDIRGTWTPMEKQDKREYISIEGWGNAYRFPSVTGSNGTDPGKWRLLNDRVVITWVDNSKDVIRMDFPHMVQESYSTDEPLTGTPFRIIKVDRAPSKE